MSDGSTPLAESRKPSISEEDILEAMKTLQGYIDLTPHDFRLLYEQAYTHARQRLLREISAGDIMKTPAVSIHSDESLEALVDLLAEHGYSGLPVMDDRDWLTGVVSAKDVLSALGFPPEARSMWMVAESLKQPLDLRAKVKGKTVADIMSTPPIQVTPETSMARVAAIFREKDINRLPVADSSGMLRGIITRANLISALSRLL